MSTTQVNITLLLVNQEASQCVKKRYQFQLCGKVGYYVYGELTFQGARTGYCINETNTHLQIITLENQNINVPKPVYNKEVSVFNTLKHQKICYDFRRCNHYEIVWVCPIRIVIFKNSLKNVMIYSNYSVTNPDGTINKGFYT